MTFTYTDVYGQARVISTHWFTGNNPAVSNWAAKYNYTLAVPSGANAVIIKAVGAGGWRQSSSWVDAAGCGAALGITKLTDIVKDEVFNIQVGTTGGSQGVGSAAGDSIVTRVTGNIVVCKGARGRDTVAGSVADSVGNIARRAGIVAPNSQRGGDSGSDINDIMSHGFKGVGARVGRDPAAGYGGGGMYEYPYDTYGNTRSFLPGGGRVMLQFWTKDMGSIV